MGDYEPLDIDRFLDKAEANRRILRKSMAGWCSVFREITIAHSAIMTPDVIKANLNDLGKPLLLANCAFAFFAAAVDVGLSAQFAPCFALQRGCIESVVYAYAIMQNPTLGAVWRGRDGPPKLEKEFRKKFEMKTLLNRLPEAGAVPRERMQEMYDITIAYGAHPNPNGALMGAEIGENEERVWLNKEFFLDGLPLQFALSWTADVGHAMVYLEDLMFHTHFLPLTLSERIRVMGQNALDEFKASHGDLSEEPEPNT